MTKEFDDKLSDVICGCKTVDQLNCALTYAKLARKSGRIGQHKYHFAWGTITTLKAVIGKSKEQET